MLGFSAWRFTAHGQVSKETLDPKPLQLTTVQADLVLLVIAKSGR